MSHARRVAQRLIRLARPGTERTDLDYIATIGSNGFGKSSDKQTLLAGAPRQFFVTLKTGF